MRFFFPSYQKTILAIIYAHHAARFLCTVVRLKCMKNDLLLLELTYPCHGDVVRTQRREHLRDLLHKVGVAGRDVLVDGETTDLHWISSPVTSVQERLDGQRHL